MSAAHIPGILNVNADRESRFHLDSSDWKLCPAVFQALQNRWGPVDIDLFASRLTNQLPRFVSWKPDPYQKQWMPSPSSGTRSRVMPFPRFAF